MDDKRLSRIEMKIDDALEHLSSIDVTLAEQHMSLKEHMRRTALLEAEILPIRKHVDMMTGAIKMIGVIATVLGIVEAIIMFRK